MNYEKFYAQFHLSPEQEAITVNYYRQYAADAPRPVPGARMLDVGCGWGFLMRAFQDAGYDTEGIDISEGQVKEACQRGANAQHVTDSAAFLHAHPGRYAVITLFDVLEHIPPSEQVRLMEAISVALAPGGVLLLKTPSAYSSAAVVMRYIDPTHQCVLTNAVLTFLCQASGLKLEALREEYRYSYRPPLSRIFTKGFWYWAGYYALRKFFRAWRRLELTSELGAEHAKSAVLSPNLYLIARKN